MVALRKNDPLTVDRVNELFTYDPVTGILAAKVVRGNTPVGYVYAPTTRIKIDGLFYKPSRLCWILHNQRLPTALIDHEDRKHMNNKANNLREATHQQNQQNSIWRGKYPPGVSAVIKYGKTYFMSKIRIAGRRLYLGSFATAEEAAEAYRQAKLKYHGEFTPKELIR